jgi:hypothetical protein
MAGTKAYEMRHCGKKRCFIATIARECRGLTPIELTFVPQKLNASGAKAVLAVARSMCLAGAKSLAWAGTDQ